MRCCCNGRDEVLRTRAKTGRLPQPASTLMVDGDSWSTELSLLMREVAALPIASSSLDSGGLTYHAQCGCTKKVEVWRSRPCLPQSGGSAWQARAKEEVEKRTNLPSGEPDLFICLDSEERDRRSEVVRVTQKCSLVVWDSLGPNASTHANRLRTYLRTNHQLIEI